MVDLRKQLRKLSLPLFFDLALVMLVGCIDTLMLSRCGDGAVAAVGLDNQLIGLVFLVYQFVSMGAAILCAQYHGAGETRRFHQIVGMALVINTAISLLMSFVLWGFSEEILRVMGLREELMPEGAVYLRITGSLSFFQAMSLTLSASLRSADKVVAPMAVNVIANVMNLCGNYILIFGHFGFPALGVAGAAWATALSRMAAFGLLWRYHTAHHIRAFPLALFKPFPVRELKTLVLVGIPAMSEEISYCLSQVVITYFINSISNAALTTRTYCVNLITFVNLFTLAVTQGGDILVGHLVGRRRYRPAYVTGTFMLHRAMAVTLVCGAILAAIGPVTMPLLTDNPWIIRTSCIIFCIDFFLNIGRVRNIFACGTLRAAGDVVYPVAVGITVQWLVAVGCGYLFGITFGLGLIGMWVAFTLDENLRGVILVRRWHSLAWCGKSFS